MARRRTKSPAQIVQQNQRIMDEIIRRIPQDGVSKSLQRSRKLNEITQRYLTNIRNSSNSMQREWNGERQFARSTYMGLSNG